MTNTPVLCGLSEFLDEASSFDYIIVGGGTAGLVVATRLTENPNIRVGVIEAGKSRLGDQNVEGPGNLSALFHNPEYDWIYKTVPQTNNNNNVHHLVRGKMLGGSSGVNFMCYVLPSASDIDWWGEQNKGWSWAELEPYYRKNEAFHVHPAQKEKRDGFVADLNFHGHSGPVQVSFPPTPAPFEDSLFKAFDEESGLPRPKEPFSGDHLGFFETPATIDRRPGKSSRSYSATGYLAPVLGRSNLKVLTEATATRILLDGVENPIARGAEFWHGGKLHKVFAKKEVIISSSTIQSPRLLELSGIGNREVLKAAGVECIVESPFVGENLQEHPMTPLIYELTGEDNITIDSVLQDNTLLQKHLSMAETTQEGFLVGNTGFMGFIPYSAQVSKETLESTIASITATRDTDQPSYHVARLRDPRSPNIHIVGIPANFDILHGHANLSKVMSGAPPGYNGCYTLAISTQFPISRGNSHIQTSEDGVSPRIDPGFLTHPADVDVLAAGLMFAERVLTESKHVNTKIGRRVDPPPEVDLKDFEQAKAFVYQRIMAFNHYLGTCGMGKVVDERLRVKGVQGLRIVDASVIPLQPSGNIVATVYAIAERAVDFIKEDNN
ncbi:hypothetical protein B7463_g3972, partial [Scytalidium lignicola]